MRACLVMLACAACTAPREPELPEPDPLAGLERAWRLAVQESAHGDARAHADADGRLIAAPFHGRDPVAFDARGIDIAGHFRLETAAVGRAGALETFPDVEPVLDGAQVRWIDDDVAAWAVPGPLGVLQGWDIARRPHGDGALVVDVVAAGAHAVPSPTGLVWEVDTGPDFGWDGVAGFDATGRVLPTGVLPTSSGARITVDDRDAVYPVLIDPLVIARPQDLSHADPSMTEGVRWGRGVAVVGSQLMVGTPFAGASNAGKVWALNSSADTWRTSVYSGFDGYTESELGASMCAIGSTLFIGAPGDRGQDGTVWYATSRPNMYDPVWSANGVLAGSPELGTRFGTQVVCGSSLVAVSAPGAGATGLFSGGSVHVIGGSTGAWSVRRAYPAPAPDEGFGVSVAIVGTTDLAIGAPDGGTGRVYIYGVSGGGGPPTAVLTPADGQAGDGFGTSVTSTATTLYIGAPGRGGGRGAVYASTKVGGIWSAPTLVASGFGEADGRFGTSVAAASGSALYVVAPQDGRGRLWLLDPAAPSGARSTEHAGDADARFGTPLQLTGGNLFVGVPDDDRWGVDAGRLMVTSVGDVELREVNPWWYRYGATGNSGAGYSYGEIAGNLAYIAYVDGSQITASRLIFDLADGWWRPMPPPTQNPNGFLLSNAGNRVAQGSAVWTYDPSAWQPEPPAPFRIDTIRGERVFTQTYTSANRQIEVRRLDQGTWASEGVIDTGVPTSGTGIAFEVADATLVYASSGLTVDGHVTRGRAWIAERRAGTWTTVATLDPPASAPRMAFGSSIVVPDDDHVLIGGGDPEAGDGGSAVWAWRRAADGTWVPDGRLEAASDGALTLPWNTATAPTPPLLRGGNGRVSLFDGRLVLFERNPWDDGWWQVGVDTAADKRASYGYDGDRAVFPTVAGPVRFRTYRHDPAAVDLVPQPLEPIDPIDRLDLDLVPDTGLVAITRPNPRLITSTASFDRVTAVLLDRLDDANEVLSATSVPAGFSATWNATTGQLSVLPTSGGPLTQAQAVAVLSGIRYRHDGGTVTTGTRRVQVAFARDVVSETRLFVHPLGQLPVVDLDAAGPGTSHASSWTEGDPPVAIAGADAVVSDADDPVMQGMTVVLTTGAADGDRLTWTPAGGLSGAWNPSTRTLTIAGVADAATYTAALRSILYDSTSTNPADGLRTFTVRARNGIGSGTAALALVTVTAVDEPPTLELVGPSPTLREVDWTEDAGPVDLIDDARVADPDDAALVRLIATLSGVGVGDVPWLSATPPPGGQVLFDGTTLTVTGPATTELWPAVLRSITFDNLTDAPSAGPIDLEVVVDDGRRRSSPVMIRVQPHAIDDDAVVDLDQATPGLDAAVSWREGAGATSATPQALVGDVDGGPAPTRIELTLAGGDGDVERLGCELAEPGLSVTEGATLELTGALDAAAWTRVLRALTYTHDGEAPTAGVRRATVTVDGLDVAELLVDVAPVDDPPTLDLDPAAPGTGTAVAWAEGDAAFALAALAQLEDVDSSIATRVEVRVPPTTGARLMATGSWGTLVSDGSGVLAATGIGVGEALALLRATTFEIPGDTPPAGMVTVTYSATLDGVTVSADALVTVTALDDPPMVDAEPGGVLPPRRVWREGDAPVALLPTATVVDPDTTSLARLTVSWSATDGAAEQVTLLGPGGPALGGAPGMVEAALALSPSATQAAVRRLAFAVEGDTPTAGVRVLDIAVADDDGRAGRAEVEVEVVPVDDPPIVDLSGPTPGVDWSTTYTSGSADASLAHAAAAVTDPDTADIDRVTFVLVERPDGADEVLDVTLPLPSGLTSTWDEASNTLVIEGPAPASGWSSALAHVVYRNVAVPPDRTRRIVRVVAAAGGLDSAAALTTVTFTSTPPALDLDDLVTGLDAVVDWTEDAGPVLAAPNAAVTDADDAEVARLSVVADTVEVGELFTGVVGATWDPGGGRLDAVGPWELADAVSLLRGLRYDAATQSPTATRTFTLEVFDASGARAAARLTVRRSGVGDPPTVDLDDTIPTAPERSVVVGSGPQVLFANHVRVADADGDPIAGVRIEAVPFDPTRQSLSLIAPGGVSSSADATGVLQIRASGSPEAWIVALQGLVWRASSGTGDIALSVVMLGDDDEGPAATATLRVLPAGADTAGDTDTTESDDADTDAEDSEPESDERPLDSDVVTDRPPTCGCAAAAGGGWTGTVGLLAAVVAWHRRRPRPCHRVS